MEIILIVSVSIVLLLSLFWLVFRYLKGSPQAKASPEISAPLDNLSAPYSKLVLGDVQHPLAVVERFEPLIPLRQEPLFISQQRLRRWHAIFQHAPSLASNTFTVTSNTYVLRFSPEVARDIANGSLKVMQSVEGGLRGIAVNAQGKIVAHSTLIPASSVTLATAAAAVWQGLALLTAQHYLPQIEHRLLQIEHGIHEIKAHLEAQDVAALVSSLKHLKSIKLLLEEMDFQETDLLTAVISLDAIDRDCGRILETYRRHMTRYAADFDTLPLAGLFSVDFATATDKAIQYEQAARICLQAMYVKGVAAQFRCAIPGDQRIASHRLQELEADLATWYTDQLSFVRRFKNRIQDDATPTLHIDGVKKLLGIGGTFSEYQKEIIDEAGRIQDTITALHDELNRAIISAIDHTSKQLSTSSQLSEIIVKLNERNEIEQISRLVKE